jgi:hypothetical protein
LSQPVQKVEIGFDILSSGLGPYFILDDPIKGKLNNTEYLLAGTLFFDVTDLVQSVAIQRGKNRQLDQFDSGLANIVFNNNDRTFDPEYALSPYAGQIVPKRQIRISSGGIVQFVGLVDDWNLSYEPNGDSTAAAACSDATSSFATQTIASFTNTVQKSGERINAILSLPEINWPVDLRDVDTGLMELGADTVPDNTNALTYLRLVERSEPGAFFIGKSGNVIFRDRIAAPTSGGVVLADDGSGIRYQSLRVQYGSELLANEVVVGSDVTLTEATALDLNSIDTYGIFNLTRTGLLINDAADVVELAEFYANKYSQPEYRFESVDILLDELTTQEQSDLLGLEIGDVVEIKFTPNGIAPAISKYAEIIRIDNSIDLDNHIMSLGFSTLDFALLVLDDAQFGKLDAGNALAF